MYRLSLLTACVLVALSLTGAATAAQLIDRDANGVQLAVNVKGEAMLTYRVAGLLKHVLVWGAVGARQPSES
ncbi:MAG: hypothetical protein ABR569_01845, partial [Gaiellaceae bacterium]